MNRSRTIILAIAIIAGGIAAYLASGSDNRPPPAPAVAQIPTVDVLVAKNDIGLGQTVTPELLQWQTWTQSTASNNFINRKQRPNAITELAGSIVRAPFIAGEPIREQKLVKANGSGFMAAILPSGMRAVSTEISPETGAGGFILPNDRVDVVLSRHEKLQSGPDAVQTDFVSSQVVLSNIRVLAIDQAPKEKEGQNTVLGKTVTLELTPPQVETLAKARLSGTLSLALRSIADGKNTRVAEAVAHHDDDSEVTVFRGVVGEKEVLDCDPMCVRRNRSR
ncbi:MAG TPA: Flp pilus assembly protein CpaB [Bradyrhizobium sp.]|nr:Flp pilus assembly protein CpaB [Bradyrhizobium sp.]